MIVPLSQVAEINPKADIPSSLAQDAMLDFLPMADVSEAGVVSVTAQRTLSEVQKGFTAFRKGDILIAKITPCFENNKIAVADITTEVGFGSTEFHVVRCKQSRLDSRYVLHLLRSNDVRAEGKKRMTGSAGQQRVPKTFLEDLQIPLPPLEQQTRIAEILDRADELRRKRQRALERLNQLGQAIFIEMFGDFTTNPFGWDTVKLGDVCRVGSSKRVFVEEFVDKGVPFYRGTEVGKLATGESIQPDLFISRSRYAELIDHSGKPHVGDLLLPSICHDGRIWRVHNDEPFYFKDGRVLWIKQNEAVLDSEYLRNHLRNLFLRNYLSIASGTTFAELKIVNLKGLSILLPPIKLQAEFSARIRSVEATRLEMVQSERASNFLFNALQHRAFRGELTASSLKEAEA